MPRYFFDFEDGGGFRRDEEGSDLAGVEEAWNEAICTLPQIAKDQLISGEHREFVATVRDEWGAGLYRATLTFHGEKLDT